MRGAKKARSKKKKVSSKDDDSVQLSRSQEQLVQTYMTKDVRELSTAKDESAKKYKAQADAFRAKKDEERRSAADALRAEKRLALGEAAGSANNNDDASTISSASISAAALRKSPYEHFTGAEWATVAVNERKLDRLYNKMKVPSEPVPPVIIQRHLLDGDVSVTSPVVSPSKDGLMEQLQLIKSSDIYAKDGASPKGAHHDDVSEISSIVTSSASQQQSLVMLASIDARGKGKSKSLKEDSALPVIPERHRVPTELEKDRAKMKAVAGVFECVRHFLFFILA
jgi:hypothetical protein